MITLKPKYLEILEAYEQHKYDPWKARNFAKRFFTSIIDDNNADIFRNCLLSLYLSLGFYVYSRDDIRPIDLSEQILQFICPYITSKSTSIPKEYTKTLRFFLQNVFVKSNSNTLYIDKAERLLGAIDQDENIFWLREAEDLTIIFIGLLREHWDYFLNPSNNLNYYELDVRKKDVEMINTFKGMTFESLSNLNNKSPSVTPTNDQMKFFYLITMVVYYRMLQIKGDYEMEGE